MDQHFCNLLGRALRRVLVGVGAFWGNHDERIARLSQGTSQGRPREGGVGRAQAMRHGRDVGTRRERLSDRPFLAPSLAEPELQPRLDFGSSGNPIDCAVAP
jgi:hypothetical protein